jgi:hypothetical protein
LEASYFGEVNKMGLEIDMKKTVGYRFGKQDGREEGQLLGLIESVINFGEDLVESKFIEINQCQILKNELQSEEITIERVEEIHNQLLILSRFPASHTHSI